MVRIHHQNQMKGDNTTISISRENSRRLWEVKLADGAKNMNEVVSQLWILWKQSKNEEVEA